VNFGKEPIHVRDIEVVSGATVHLTCKLLVQSCEVSP
jgi:hypothetical protein